MARAKRGAAPPPPAPPSPSPRSRILPLALLALVAAAALGWWVTRPPGFRLGASSDRNVLLVTIDTLRADALGAYGGRAATPTLDALAASGARFDFAHAHAVVTLPSHASILTGRYPYEHGIRDNTGYRLAAGQATAATLFKAGGFATGAFVGGFPLDRRFGLNAGFDVYDDRLHAAFGEEAGERERRADAVVQSALGWIDAQQGRWFGWVHVYDPHVAYAAPAEFAARYPADPYLAEVAWTDAALQPLFARLRRGNRPTLVVVTADHGESRGEHGELTHGIFAYESTLRVPLIVADIDPAQPAPGAGVVVSTPVRHVDLLPTLLEAAGLAVPAELPGASLAAPIAGDTADRPSYFESMMATVTRGWAPLRGVLVGREKYIDLPIAELYDLAADQHEAKNLAPSQPNRSEVLLRTLGTFDVAPPGRAREESAQTIERLRSLGYISGGSAAVRDQYTEADDPKRLIVLEHKLSAAAEAHRNGRPDEAIALYREVLALRPDTEDAWRRLALIYWRAGRPADAISALEEALRNGVTQREVRNKLGQYLAEAGQPAKAIALLEGDAGDDPDALIALGNAYELAGRHADALETFRRMVAADPANGLAYENLGIIQLQGRALADAEVSLRRAVELDASLSAAHTALGVILAQTGRRDEAITMWARAVSLDPTDLNALFNLTLNLVESGRREEARTYGQRFVLTAPPSMARDIETVRRATGLR
jgi:tetratricopeptide (TPR) repeat protein